MIILYLWLSSVICGHWFKSSEGEDVWLIEIITYQYFRVCPQSTNFCHPQDTQADDKCFKKKNPYNILEKN